MMKGVILAAGKGTRLYPLTKVIPKCILPVYDKPMIYYPIETLKKFGIVDIMVVVSLEQKDMFTNLLGDGSEFGVNITYEIQKEAKGNAHAFKLAREFVGSDDVVLIFGDNLFIGNYDNIVDVSIKNLKDGYASIFAVSVLNPSAYGVINCDEDNNVLSIEEKPERPKSNLIAPGLYVYDSNVFSKVDMIKVSERGEYEITDVNKLYLSEGKLKVVRIDEQKCKWFDTGNVDVLLDASNVVRENN